MTDTIRILFVDNDVDQREWLAEKLRQKYRFEIDCADDDEAAIERVAVMKGNYDVALVDMRLGARLGGIDVMKSIKSNYPDIEVIIVTGFGDVDDGVRAMEEGACNYVFKPWRDEELVVYIRAAAERRRLKWMQNILSISQAMTESLDPEQIAREVCERVASLIPNLKLFYIASYDKDLDEVSFPWAISATGKVELKPRQLADGEKAGIAGYVIRSKEPLIEPDLEEVESLRSIRLNLLGITTRACISLPLISRGNLIGVLSAQSQLPDVFTSDHKRLLQAIANQTAVAIDNAIQYQQTAHRLGILSRLYNTLATLRTEVRLDHVLRPIVNNLYDLFQLDTCTVGLFDKDLVKVDFVAERGLDSRVERKLKDLPKDIRDLAFATSDLIGVLDLDQHPELRKILVKPDLKSFVILPLHGKKEPLGIITMGSKKVLELSDEQKELLRALSDQAAIAIENARLHEETAAWAQQLDRLDQVAQDIANEKDHTKLLLTVASNAVEFLKANGSGVYLLAENKKEFVLVATTGQIRGLEGRRFLTDKGVIGRVLRDKKPFRVADYWQWPDRLKVFDSKKQTAVMGVPIFSNAEMLGVLVVHDVADGRSFSESEEELFSRIGRLAGAEIEKAQILEKNKKLLFEREVTSELAQALVSELRYDQLLKTIYENFHKRLGYSTYAIFLKDPEKRELYILEGAIGYTKEIVRTLRIKIDDEEKGITALVYRSGDPKTVPDVDKEPMYIRSVPDSCSEICVPLVYRGETIGVLNVESGKLGAFGESDLRILTQAAATIAIAIKNAGLFTKTSEQLSAAKSVAILLAATSAWAHDASQHTYTLDCDAAILVALLDGVSGLDPRVLEAAKRIGETAEKVAALIPPTPSDFIQEERVHIGEVLLKVQKQYSRELDEKNIKLENQIGDLPPVLANNQALHQVCDNLLRNAIRSVPYGGQISFSGRADGKQLFVEITDTGPGIPIELRPDIFNRRVRGYGTGIGLLLTRSYLLAFDGDIKWVEKDSPGTTFEFNLPLAQEAATTEKEGFYA